MYNNSTQYPGQNYQSAYPQYPPNYTTNYGYQGYDSQQYANAQPAPPGENYPQNSWTTTTGYIATTYEDDRKEAVAQELKQQKAQLIKQREDYVKKAFVLRRELDQLRNQKQDLLSDGHPDRDLELILRENDKLQEEIQGKMKAIHNVIEMLSSIIKDGQRLTDLEASLLDDSPKSRRDSHGSPTHESTNDSNSKYSYVHYDTGLHWCRLCDEFPETAKEFLLHLQSKKHLENAKETDVGDNTPWHKLPAEPVLPSHDDAPKKRIPIKGLQFFISAPSWYCKLCDTWIGDLHCASHHLKSQAHFQNYDIFVEQNPHWEMEWLKDREKAMSRTDKRDSSDSDEEGKKKKKRKDKRISLESILKDSKKKKKRSKKHRKHSSDTSSSSSSSESSSEEEQNDKSKSIRVEMRNKKVQSIMNEDIHGKWSVLERLVQEHKKKEDMLNKEKEKQLDKKDSEDTLITQWMSVSKPQERDKHMLDSLKDRMKQKQEAEKAKQAEMERKKLEKEREEKELQEKKQKEAREAAETAERERQRREKEELERIRDKDRNQVKFKTRDHYRRQRDNSRSSDEEKSSPRHKHYKQSSPPNRYKRSRDRERSRSRSNERKSDRKKPPGPPSYKKLPFIGRMPLFKNKKHEEKVEKEIKKEDYEPQRRTRFQPGNLAKAFIPQPEVVCFPKLSSYPPLITPPPAPTVAELIEPPPPPEPPKISKKTLKAPPPPKIGNKEEKILEEQTVEAVEDYGQMDPSMMAHYYPDYNMMYSQMYDFSQDENSVTASSEIPISHTMPLMPPPLPPSEPEDDLAMLGMCADDMAAQSF